MFYFKFLSLLFFTLAVVLQFVSFVRLRLLKRAAGNMKTLRHRLLKQMFLRFTNCAKLNIRIRNTSVFVNHYLASYKAYGFSYGLGAKLGLICFMANIFVTICGIYSYGDTYHTYALISVLYAMFYIFFCLLFDITQLENQIVDIVTDYLDNTVSHRIKAAEVKVPAVNAAATTRELNSPQVSAQTSRRKSSQNTQKNNPDEIIFSVINDFLI
jgi:hypothetical protein